jgi:sugar phosphate permease
VSKDASYRWVVLGVGLFAMTAGAAAAQGLASITPALREHYGIQLGTVGVLLGAVSLGIVPAVLPWGLAADRWGERPVMAIGMLSAAAVLTLLSQQKHLVAVVVLLIVSGAASASVNAASGRAVMQWFPAKGRGMAMAIRQTSSPLGAGLAALVLPSMARLYGVPAVYLFLAGFCALGAVAVLLFMRPAPKTSQPTVGKPAPSRPSVLRDRRLWVICAVAGLLVVPQFALTALLVEYLHTRHQLTVAGAAAVLAVAQGCGAVARLVNGAWADHVGDRLGPLAKVAALTALGCVAVVATGRAPLPIVVVVLVIAATFAISWNGLANLVAAELAGADQAGAALGLENTTAFLAAAVTPPVLAVVIQQSSWSVGHAIPAVASAVACLLMVRLIRSVRLADGRITALAPSGQ